jgi:hypothetical protein
MSKVETQTYLLKRDDAVPPVLSITGYLVAESESQWKPRKTLRENPTEGATRYRTVFRLYFAPKSSRYFLHKLGESSDAGEVTRYSIIDFDSPADFLTIINNPEDHRVHSSRPLVDLLNRVMECQQLNKKQVSEWEKLLRAEG